MAPQLRPLSIGELLDQTFRMYRDHFVLFVGIAAVPQLLVLLTSVLTYAIPGLHTNLGETPSGGAVFGTFFIAFPLIMTASLGAWCVAQGATVSAVSEVYMDRTTTVEQSLRVALRRFFPLLGLFFLIGIGMVLGMFAFFVGALVVALFCSLSVNALVIEERSPTDAIKRSIDLVKSDVGKVLLMLIVFGVIEYAVYTMLGIPTFVLSIMFTARHSAPAWFLPASQVAGFVTSSLVKPLMGIGLSLLYYDIRIRREAFDLQVMMSSLGPATPPAPSASSAASPL